MVQNHFEPVKGQGINERKYLVTVKAILFREIEDVGLSEYYTAKQAYLFTTGK